MIDNSAFDTLEAPVVLPLENGNYVPPIKPQRSVADAEDISDLSGRITVFRTGQEDGERFRHFRLTRGVYGQRQAEVQMFRTKIPFGKITAGQLTALADLSDAVSNGRLHLTTRQNIQLHFVRLENSVKIWETLAAHNMTGLGACGNTVRNITASATAGIDPDEPFDVTPYAYAAYRYFLRNPVCQDMGRKIKPAFSSSEKDSAFTYFHDFGFIPRLRTVDGKEQRGFKVLVGGGLGAQAISAHVAHEFLEEDLLIPFMEATLRVFDRHGEREKRMKARMKFLIQKMGLETFLELVALEQRVLENQRVPVNRYAVPQPKPAPLKAGYQSFTNDAEKYLLWLKTNVMPQKQRGFFAANLKVRLGNLDSETARQLAKIVQEHAADDIRITVNQGLLLKYIRPGALPELFNALDAIGLADPGFGSIADITACPGTDTCALGVTNSTGLANQLETVIKEEFPHLLEETQLHIKISGCMNSCGQHVAGSIGFHGSSLKRGELVVPAVQVLLGGGVTPEGQGFMAEKIIKLPTRRAPEALRLLLDDFEQNGTEGEYFSAYFRRQAERYFYDLLKPLADLSTLEPEGLFDWGQSQQYVQAIGVGECAGVSLDLVGAILGDAQKKVHTAHAALDEEAPGDAIYHAYTAYVVAAKAALLSKDVKCNTQIGILDDFQKHYVEADGFALSGGYPDFQSKVLQVSQEEPKEQFARRYTAQAAAFVGQIISLREAQIGKVVEASYRA